MAPKGETIKDSYFMEFLTSQNILQKNVLLQKKIVRIINQTTITVGLILEHNKN